MIDKLDDIFEKQYMLEERFSKIDKSIVWPPENLDISSKSGQAVLRDIAFRMVEELYEAFRHLKNKPHSVKDNRQINLDELREEIADVFVYMVNLCLFLKIDSQTLYDEFCKKCEKNNKRIDNGY